ncbi:MAG: MotA/TolQ/ExbB proton channel family protein [Campylobacterota bacterium]|nr:MotA/TolQ/ExbB proton channel family protein [Campylobacterota bacterium]
MMIDNSFGNLSLFLDAGGSVLVVLLLISIVFWALIIERVFYFKFVYHPLSKKLVKYWKEQKDGHSWGDEQLKLAQISSLHINLQANLPTIKVIIALFPLLGLLGTITGMISVFDSMSSLGTNAKAMASGISMATIPTMAGMMLAVLGLFAYSRLDAIAKKEILLLHDKLGGF